MLEVLHKETDLIECVDLCFESHYENEQKLGVDPSRLAVYETFKDCLGLVLKSKDCGIIEGCLFIDTNYKPWFSTDTQYAIAFIYLKPEYRNYKNFSILIKAAKDIAKQNKMSLVAGAYSGVNTEKIGNLLERKDFELIEKVYLYNG